MNGMYYALCDDDDDDDDDDNAASVDRVPWAV